MADQKPPKMVAAERATLLGLLQYHRNSICDKVTGLDEAQARWSPVGSGTSLRWLLHHLTVAEALWVEYRLAGRDRSVVPDELVDDDTMASIVSRYVAQWERSATVLETMDLDALAATTDGDDPVNARWVLTHLLEETARHAGHADIVRELPDGSTGR